MTQKKDFYQILGLNDSDKKLKGSEWNKKLKEKYRKLSREWHPDRFGNKPELEKKLAEEKMKEINEAYETLKDPDKRRKYDRPEPDFSNMRGDDFFGGFRGMNMNDMYDFFRGSQRTERKPRGGNKNMRIPLDIEEIINGCKKKVKYKRIVRCQDCHGDGGTGKKVCPHCHGRGRIVKNIQLGANQFFQTESTCPYCHGQGYKFEHPCKTCGGKGFEEVEEIIEVTFRPGVMEGETFRAVGKGNQSPDKNGIDGDFNGIASYNYDRSKFNLDNYPHILYKAKLNWVDALLGGKMSIKIPGKSEQTVEIPECTKPGDQITIKGAGLTVPREIAYEAFSTNTAIQGDCILCVEYAIPKSLTSEQKEILKKFKKTLKQ